MHILSHLLYVELLEGLSGAVDSVLLHLFSHVGVLDDCLAVGHSGVGSVTSEHTGAVQPSDTFGVHADALLHAPSHGQRASGSGRAETRVQHRAPTHTAWAARRRAGGLEKSSPQRQRTQPSPAPELALLPPGLNTPLCAATERRRAQRLLWFFGFATLARSSVVFTRNQITMRYLFLHETDLI